VGFGDWFVVLLEVFVDGECDVDVVDLYDC